MTTRPIRTTRGPRLVVLLAVAAAAAIVVTACSSSAATQAPAATPASPAAPASQATGGAYTVTLAQDAKLGGYLAGENGKALYLLTSDTADTSTCSGACAAAWPPFVLEGAETVAAGDGVTGTLATMTRADDGSKQVTYNGIPLYYFAKDTKAGDVLGQGVKGVWFLVAPGSTAQGGTITGGVGQVAAPAASPSAGGGRYGSSESAAPAGASIQVANFAFSPATLTVKAGSTVTWSNADTASHTVTADDGSFDSGTLAKGSSFSQTFAKAGTYSYHCSIHTSMTATVTVTE